MIVYFIWGVMRSYEGQNKGKFLNFFSYQRFFIHCNITFYIKKS